MLATDLFRAFPSSTAPFMTEPCPVCHKMPDFWILFAFRIQVPGVLEFDVYRPSCDCSVYFESVRGISFFAQYDYSRSPWDTASEFYNIQHTEDKGIILAAKQEHPDCDGNCDSCLLSGWD